jgi:hypothetical protein
MTTKELAYGNGSEPDNWVAAGGAASDLAL